MIPLESPIHALAAYKYFNDAGILAAVTWAAVLTAALSFWKIRGVSNSISSSRSSNHDLPAPPPVFDDASEPSAKIQDSQPVVHAGAALYCGGGKVKSKFRVYFDEEDCYGDGDECGSSEEEDAEIVCRNFDWEYGGDWERRAAVRMVDMGWYRSQDLRMLDGSVVRLWDQSVAGVRL